MRHLILILTFHFSFFIYEKSYCQCATSTDGQNLVTNGDFSAGSTGFTSSYTVNCPGPSGSTSAGQYCVTNDITNFHCCLPNFSGTITNTFTDHSPSVDNYALLVDGSSTGGTDIWCQTVNVQPSTNYYFTAYVGTLFYDGDPNKLGKLRFKINGAQVGTTITSPTAQGAWTAYTYVWSSGATSGAVSICISNDAAASDPGNDFALDDVAFTAGCAYGDPGPVPLINSGDATATLCGNPTGVVLNSGVPATGSPEFVWKRNGSVIGGAVSSSYNATTIGTYEVCVRTTTPSASCWRSDNITVTNTYSIDLGPNVTLCNPPSVTLDAGHSGSGVTYIWRKDGSLISGATSQTYLVTSPGTYVVEVTDPLCGVQSDNILINSTLTATPNDANFCTTPSAVSLSVTGSGTFNWYNVTSGGSILSGGSNTTAYTTPPISSTTTYYVEDATLTVYNNVGPDNSADGYVASGGVDRHNDTYTSSTPAYIEFETFKNNTQIQQVDLNAFCEGAPCNGTIRMSFYNTSGVLVTESADIPVNMATGWSYVTLPIVVNTTLASAGIYRASVKIISNTGGAIKFGANRFISAPCNFPALYDVTGTLDFRSAQVASTGHCGWPYFYNWRIAAPGGCGRIPVQAIHNCPMPVTMLSFDIKKDGKNALLNWNVVEDNVAYYSIEYSSNGIDFEQAGLISSHIENGTSQYSFTDHSLIPGVHYYRLKIYDLDGSYTYSGIKQVIMEVTSAKVFPNPSNGLLNIVVPEGEDEEYTVEVINSIGQTVYFRQHNLPELSVQLFASGCYLVKLNYKNSVEVIKIMVE